MTASMVRLRIKESDSSPLIKKQALKIFKKIQEEDDLNKHVSILSEENKNNLEKEKTLLMKLKEDSKGLLNYSELEEELVKINRKKIALEDLQSKLFHKVEAMEVISKKRDFLKRDIEKAEEEKNSLNELTDRFRISAAEVSTLNLELISLNEKLKGCEEANSQLSLVVSKLRDVEIDHGILEARLKETKSKKTRSIVEKKIDSIRRRISKMEMKDKAFTLLKNAMTDYFQEYI